LKGIDETDEIFIYKLIETLGYRSQKEDVFWEGVDMGYIKEYLELSEKTEMELIRQYGILKECICLLSIKEKYLSSSSPLAKQNNLPPTELNKLPRFLVIGRDTLLLEAQDNTIVTEIYLRAGPYKYYRGLIQKDYRGLIHKEEYDKICSLVVKEKEILERYPLYEQLKRLDEIFLYTFPRLLDDQGYCGFASEILVNSLQILGHKNVHRYYEKIWNHSFVVKEHKDNDKAIYIDFRIRQFVGMINGVEQLLKLSEEFANLWLMYEQRESQCDSLGRDLLKKESFKDTENPGFLNQRLWQLSKEKASSPMDEEIILRGSLSRYIPAFRKWLAGQIGENKRVLSVGCGKNGVLEAELKKSGNIVLGVDKRKEAKSNPQIRVIICDAVYMSL
ncbi:MAG: hypothetical protein N2Z79_00540, partial [Candidatus Omnitrophica bacterium]|nr:hypothetical protein [Candidatus Omnitrophota bacterium]